MLDGIYKMRIFEQCEFTKECPICNTKEKGDAILIGISGTEEGNNMEALLFHVKCINLRYYKEDKIIAQRW